MTIRPNNINSRNAPNIQSVVEVRHGAREPQLGGLVPGYDKSKERNNFDLACVGGRERNGLMRSGL